ncbi:MAG: 3-dehydroquinate synthase [Oscillospiraceae bacterium]|nr:3-dehydroquinate synthase [Oscillospiraceae bacterium]
MKTVRVNASKPYDVIIGHGLLRNAGEYISKVTKAKRFAVICDDNIAPIYLDTVKASLENEGYAWEEFVFPHGESSKSTDTLVRIYSFLASAHFTRTDAVIALGGGVTGDMAGYAAATYLRGMDLIQIPTSLLAQVDSSVGGKTAIDIPEGKNLVGAFKQPDLVLIDTDTIATLPRYYLIDGMGEVVKYGMIRSASLFEKLCGCDIDHIGGILDDIIYECVSIKRDVVEADEFDRGERALLNFGHTLGHSIEQYYHYTGISHGRAVAKGMQLVTAIAEEHGLCGEGLGKRLEECLAKYELVIEVEPTLPQLGTAVLNDKKRDGDSIGIVVCDKVGHSSVVKMTVDTFLSYLG